MLFLFIIIIIIIIIYSMLGIGKHNLCKSESGSSMVAKKVWNSKGCLFKYPQYFLFFFLSLKDVGSNPRDNR